MPNALKKAIDIATTAALIVFVLFVILLAGVRLFGVEPHIVLSGSMEPEIMTGSLVYVTRLSPAEARELEAGDTVTFVNKGDIKVTHKIYEVVGPAYVKDQHGETVLDENGQPTVAKDANGEPIVMYVTYGINNKNQANQYGYTLDGEPGVGNLASTNVFGKPVFSIPFLGYIAHFVQNSPGRYIALGGCLILVLLSILTGKDDGDEKGKGEQDDSEPHPEQTPDTDTAQQSADDTAESAERPPEQQG